LLFQGLAPHGEIALQELVPRCFKQCLKGGVARTKQRLAKGVVNDGRC
jgi:hypothetical protein